MKMEIDFVIVICCLVSPFLFVLSVPILYISKHVTLLLVKKYSFRWKKNMFSHYVLNVDNV